MNEITNVLKIANTAFRTVQIIDIVKKTVIASAAVACCVFAVKFIKK